eukprot:GSMAST32.ASY1.ANO1.1375.1 assembled CDS
MEILSTSKRTTTPGTGRQGRDGRRPLETRLSLYTIPPSQDVSLDEFESFAYDRLQVLQAIATAQDQGLKGEEFSAAVKKIHDRVLRLRFKGDERKDTISHYILRLAYCQTEELRRWFLSNECALFRHRFKEESPKDVDAFMRIYKLNYEQISASDRELFSRQLRQVHAANAYGNKTEQLEINYFRLVQRRQVFVNDGFAFVPREHLINLLQPLAAKSMVRVLSDNRLTPLLKNISRQYLGKDYSADVKILDKVTPAMIDSLSRSSMPMCMNNLHTAMRQQHHLKYEGRQQYGLFLKGIGLSLEDAMTFWKNTFTKKMSSDDFDKKYAYNIRHSYGKEGKRANYTPHGCMKIIMGPAPAAGQSHGCPFRHWDDTHLRARLSKLKVSGSDINNIIDAAKNGHFQIACRKHFEVTHKGADANDVGNHPNAWFDASRRFIDEEMENENEAANTANMKQTGGSSVKSFTISNTSSTIPTTA